MTGIGDPWWFLGTNTLKTNRMQQASVSRGGSGREYQNMSSKICRNENSICGHCVSSIYLKCLQVCMIPILCELPTNLKTMGLHWIGTHTQDSKTIVLHYLKMAQNCMEQPISTACISHRPACLSIRGAPLLWLQYGSSKQKQCREQTGQCKQASLTNTIHGVGRKNRPSLVKTVTLPNFVNRQCLHSSIVAPFTINKSGNRIHSRPYNGASLIQAPLAPSREMQISNASHFES